MQKLKLHHFPSSGGRICPPCELSDSVKIAFETVKLLLQSGEFFLSFEGKRCSFPLNIHTCCRRLSCGAVSFSSPMGKITIENNPKCTHCQKNEKIKKKEEKHSQIQWQQAINCDAWQFFAVCKCIKWAILPFL